ncbi:MAG TPA: ATP-binding cassette domain-containing protein [Rhodospirillales bacterium]|nr:ATP-binding cassette domain-containing protein [Rhodospirillales bacterium]HIA82611.1 ATP-binding cassette domain-containing protein [Rhodospirillales bacterium]HIB20371.1 ATP-binding cassette domain-containing protein [Rhodospirillales bacterium]HIN74924.1 ATP-binding cassette domain-containing protein [Rhodospirillales bacterium]HIO39903.1 ATP-binding cassette domain-containing protein [Rhodospirillales bacterium]
MQPAGKPNEQHPALECKNVGCTFMIGKGILSPKKPLRAVDDVSLKINRGQVFAVVGESGCGKTTLARMLLGLLEPTDGEIYLDGQPISEVRSDVISRKVQPVFQDPYSSLNPRKTIESIISLPLRVHDIGTKESRMDRVSELMHLVGLPSRLIHSYPNQLSGGQRQRVAIARALIMEPGIIVCDEPTSALDVSVQAHILNLLQDLKDKFNLTYIFISHDLAVVEHLADWVAVMYLGRLIEFGSASEVLRNPLHPYTQALMESVLTPDPRKGLPEITFGRGLPNPLEPPSGCNFHPRCSKIIDGCDSKMPKLLPESDRLVECHLYN